MKVSPSGTATGRSWLENFWPADRDAAHFLLDSLHFYSDSLIRTNLHDLLSHFIAESEPANPVAVLPVRDPLDFSGVPTAPTAFVHYDPRDLSSAPGSEAAAANLARQLARAQPEVLGPQAGLIEWKERKARSVVLIEDFAASGDQAYSFLESLKRNRTIRSWHSFGWVRFHLFFFAASLKAVKRIEQHPLVSSVRISRTLPDVHTVPLDPLVSRRSVIKLCQKYGRGDLPKLGHDDCGSLFARQSSVPDGLPSIFLQSRGRTPDGKAWRPLFPNRNLPADLEQLAAVGYMPTYLDHFMAKLPNGRLAASYHRHGLFPTELLPIVLIELRGRAQYAIELAHSTSTPLAEIENALATLRGWGLVTERNRLTDDGQAEARALTRPATSAARHPTRSAQPGSFYYPLQLRGVDDV